MKKENGITLMALVIYLVVFIMVIGIIATLTSYFYTNVIDFDETTKSYSEINKFNMYFLQDIKNKNNIIQNLVVGNTNEGEKITIYNSENFELTKYVFEKNSIYRNGILIAKNIKEFRLNMDSENSEILNIYIETLGNAGFTKTLKYAI